MSRKHFVKFAEFIRNYGSECEPSAKEVNLQVRKDMARMVCSIAADDNDRFDKNIFMRACGLS